MKVTIPDLLGGPWHVEEEIDGMPAYAHKRTRVFTSAGERVQIASTFNQTRLHLQPNYDEAERLAVAISALPDLLAAIKGLAGVFASLEEEPELDAEILEKIHNVRAAVDKAEGRKAEE